MIYDVPLKWEALKGFTPHIRPLADGIRASTASKCLGCAIIEYLNPSDERVFGAFQEGVNTFGQFCHQAWSYQSFGAGGYVLEDGIPWGTDAVKLGVAHDDTGVPEGKHCGHYEFKTHSEKDAKSPSGDNEEQTRWRMRLRQRAGLPVYGPTRIVTMSTAGREKGIARGPWEVTLSPTQAAEIDAKIEQLAEFMSGIVGTPDLHGPKLHALADGCTRCFPKPVQPARGGADGLLGRYATLKHEFDEIDAQRATYAEAKAELKKDLDKLRAEIDPKVPEGVVIEAMNGAKATRNRAGNLTITLPANAA